MMVLAVAQALGLAMEVGPVPLAVRAVYNRGRLRLLDPVDLSEGEEVQLVILSEETRELSALADMLAEVSEISAEDVDEEALLREVETELVDQTPLSDVIIEERHQGP